jgi:uncharacterized protein YecE (DUF72 family)
MPGTIRIGISGWRYKPWRGVFYPKGLPQKRELPYAANLFGSIEINGTFYSLQQPNAFAQWAASTPADFVFAIKGSRYITHLLRLKNVRRPLANFFASGLLRLGAKMGPILWQLPPNFKYDPGRLEEFFKLLPRDAHAAAALARRHDKRIRAASFKPLVEGPVRHAIEIRHVSFAVPQFIEMLRKHDVALVCADAVEWPRLMDVTSNFVYCRLHGSQELYASGYDKTSLDEWARRVVAWAKGQQPRDAEVVSPRTPRRLLRDVFVYFDNDAKVRAPFDAQQLAMHVNDKLPRATSPGRSNKIAPLALWPVPANG